MEATSVVSVDQSLDELRALLDSTPDSPERMGLEAFIECVTPELLNRTMTYLGKIQRTTEALLKEPVTTMEALDALRDDFDIIVEPAAS
jgi:hypothetical protein